MTDHVAIAHNIHVARRKLADARCIYRVTRRTLLAAKAAGMGDRRHHIASALRARAAVRQARENLRLALQQK